jgi:hypothetical protein
MPQKIVIRTFIVLFGLIAVSVVGARILAGDGNPTEELHAAASEFSSNPTEDKLRRLMNIETDASYSFLQMALVGQAFAEQPAIFRSVAASPSTPLERSCIDDLGRLGEQVFEHYEELKPPDFEATLRSATWLKSEAQQAMSGNAVPPAP